ncbi:MFS transporter [Clostridium tyrobutyricum]|uniref:MFS transporter n=1 Tax=Clostridium tyrobutyricum TaxID=1519 RepID=UPI00031C288E|nr:MFS transporter [Clostridium tyrobutyricum]
MEQSSYKSQGLSSKNLVNRMESLPIGKFHYKLLIINGAAWAFDAFDVGIVTFIVTALVKDWHLSTAQVGLFLSVGMFGMLFGAASAGPMADHFGRKSVFKITMLIYSIFSLICAFSPNFTFLLVARFLVGFGIGGETPVVTSILGEFIPASKRGKIQGLIDAFWAIGWVAAAMIAYFVIPTIGWRWTFVIGALPAFFIFVIRRHLPESPRWFISKGRMEEAKQVVDDIEQSLVAQGISIPEVNQDVADDVVSTSKEKIGIASLFSKKYFKRSIMFSLVWLLGMFGYYGLFSWLPTIFVKAGYNMVHSFLYVLIMQIAFVPNQFICAYLMDKVGRKVLLIPNLILAGITVVLYGWALGHGVNITAVVIIGVFASFFVSATWAVLYTYTPESYPTRIRATGVSFSSTCSRIGSMLAPIVIGSGLTSMGISGVFMVVAGSFIISAVLVGGLGQETKGIVLKD